eukprot:IDg18624t1
MIRICSLEFGYCCLMRARPQPRKSPTLTVSLPEETNCSNMPAVCPAWTYVSASAGYLNLLCMLSRSTHVFHNQYEAFGSQMPWQVLGAQPTAVAVAIASAISLEFGTLRFFWDNHPTVPAIIIEGRSCCVNLVANEAKGETATP